MNDDVSGFAKHGCGIGNYWHAPGRVRSADNLAEIASSFCRILINCADYFDGGFFSEQADNGGTDWTDSVLNGANFLFLQDIPPFSSRNSRRDTSL